MRPGYSKTDFSVASRSTRCERSSGLSSRGRWFSIGSRVIEDSLSLSAFPRPRRWTRCPGRPATRRPTPISIWRRRPGRPPAAGRVSINWGFWGQSRVVARPAYRAFIEAQGLLPISHEAGVRALFLALAVDRPQLVINRLDLRQLQQAGRRGLHGQLAAAETEAWQATCPPLAIAVGG